MTRSASLRRAAALLLVLATMIFVIGISAERSAGEASEARPAENAVATGNETSEGVSDERAEDHDESAEAEEANEEGAQEAGEAEARADEAAEPHDEANEASEAIFGINPESTGAVAAAVVISLLLAAALWLWGTPLVFGAAAAFALAFTVLDVREVLHQVGESRGGLAALALAVAVLHVAVAVIAGLALTRRGSPDVTPSEA